MSDKVLRKGCGLIVLAFTAALLLSSVSAFAHSSQTSHLKAGDPLVVDASSGLNLRPHPNSGKIAVIPDGYVIYATGAARLHETGRNGSSNKYWAPVRYQNETGDWMEGWVLLSYANRVAPTPQIRPGTVLPNVPAVAQAESGPLPETIVTQAQEPTPEVALPQTQVAGSEAQTEVQPDKFLLTVKVLTNARIRSGPGTRNAIIGRFTNGTKVLVLGKPVGNWVPIQKEGSGEKGWMHVSLLEAEGRLNPLQIARSHPVGSNIADEQIDTFAEDQTTEAGDVSGCDGSEACRNGGLERLPVTSDEGFISPVDGSIRSRFGPRTDPITGQAGSTHGGLDLTASTGTSVRNIKPGRVVALQTGCNVGNRGCGGGWGNYVMIDHGNGLRSVYAHLSSVKVEEGQRVDANTIIALSGNSGRSTGPHLHLEVHQNGVKKNPLDYIPN